MKSRYMKSMWPAIGVVVFALALPPVVDAAEPVVEADAMPGAFSASVALTSEYFFRGISQSDDTPAVQGEIGYGYDFEPVTASIGVWASNVRFTDADIEVDYTASLGGEVEGVSWGVGGIYYNYPGAAGSLNYDYWEVFGTLGYDFKIFSVEVGVNHSPDNFGASGDSTYVAAGVTVPLGKYVDFGFAVGHQAIEKEDVFGVPDYFDFLVSLGINIAGVDFTTAYTDTDLSTSECDDACGQVLFTVAHAS